MTTQDRLSNNTLPSQGAWLAYTINDFTNRIKKLALKHNVTITYLDIAKKQIYFDCDYEDEYDFAAGLDAIVEDFKHSAPVLFTEPEPQNPIRTVHGWMYNEFINLNEGEE